MTDPLFLSGTMLLESCWADVEMARI